MKICPRCGHQCHDEDLYCNECKSNISQVKPVKVSRWRKHVPAKTAGCIIVLAVIIVVVLAAILLPEVFAGNCHADFGKGFLEMIPER